LTLVNNPPSWEATLAAAFTALKQAETLLAREPDLARGPLLSQVRLVKTKLEADEKDRRLLADFDDIREKQDRRNSVRQPLRKDHIYPDLKAALKRYGLPITEHPTKDAASYLRGRPAPIQNQVLAVVQACFAHVPRDKAEDLKWLKAVLAEADTDP